LAQDTELQQLIRRLSAQPACGAAAQQWELLVRVAVFKTATEVVAVLFQQAADRIDALYQPKPGEHYKGREPLQTQGIFGSFDIQRDYYFDLAKGQGHFPADAALGLEGGYTPALARLICLESVDTAGFEKAQEHLRETGGIDVSARQMQRVVQRVGPAAQAWQERQTPPEPCKAPILYISGDGTGLPMRQEELAGRKGKQPGGGAKTRQAYLGCVFTQHKRDEKGSPIRDHNSTSYVSTMAPVEDFGLLLRKEALRRGSGTAGKIVMLIDGAAGLENLGRVNFPGALQIIDFYHACEHLKTLLESLWGKDHPYIKKQRHRWAKLLLKDGVEQIIRQARLWSRGKASQDRVSKALGYFERNIQRMQYGTFRKAGYFVGSGVVEAGCKTVIGARCKQSGMFWSEEGAENILALRCIKSSRHWESFWKKRANDHARRNDALALSA
jgi:uncharacterized protein UPF0236